MNVNPDDFNIDQSNIDNELCSLGKRMYEYGEQEGKLRVAVDDAKNNVEFVEGALDASIRDQAKAAGTKTTEAQVRNQIISSPLYKDALSKLMEAQRSHAIIRAAFSAICAKKDCLIALSYRDRQLMKAEMY